MKKGSKMSLKSRKRISKAMKGRIVSKTTRKKISLAKKGNTFHSLETRKLISKNSWQKGKRPWNFGLTKENHLSIAKYSKKLKLLTGEKNSQYGKRFSKEHRRKISESEKGTKSNMDCSLSEQHKNKIRYIHAKRLKENGQNSPWYSRRACKFFKALNKKYNLNGFHAENKGEFLIKGLGYFPDYYEPNLNLILEWNERKHYKDGRLIKKHKTRQKKIKRYLKCHFININQRTFSKGKQLKRILNKIEKIINKQAVQKLAA